MSRAITSLAVFLFAGTMQAGVLVGFIGTEPGTPIGGEEDIVIYNSTGIDGCSAPAGTPVCTSLTFENIVLTINGVTTLDLPNFDPGSQDTFNDPAGVFVDGSIKSLALSLSLSTTGLVIDPSQLLNVIPTIIMTNIPVNGSLVPIDATLLAPEPSTLPLLLSIFIVLMMSWVSKKRDRNKRVLDIR